MWSVYLYIYIESTEIVMTAASAEEDLVTYIKSKKFTYFNNLGWVVLMRYASMNRFCIQFYVHVTTVQVHTIMHQYFLILFS